MRIYGKFGLFEKNLKRDKKLVKMSKAYVREDVQKDL